MKTRFLRAASWFVFFTFTFTSLNPVSFAMTPEVSSAPFKTLAIPAEFGQVTDMSAGSPGAPALIHIQSAHGNFSAEKNIENLLGFIEKKSNVRLMLLEGAASKLQPEFLRIFKKHPDFNRKVTDKLMQEGYLTGPESFLVETSKKMEGWGIEDRNAYKKDREAFMTVVKADPKTRSFLLKRRADLSKQFASKLGKDLLTFVRQGEAFDTAAVSFEAWLKVLADSAAKNLRLDLADVYNQVEWPFLVRYERLHAIGSKIDSQKARSEAQSFLKELQKRKISKEIITSFQNILSTPEAELFKTAGKAADGYSPVRLAFDRAFSKLPKDFSMKAWPNWSLYAQYAILTQELESKGLHEEILRLQDKVLDVLAKTADEKVYVAQSRELNLLRKLFALELNREEYEALKTQRDSGLGTSPAMQTVFAAAMDFYATAVVRENKMFANALAKMAERKEKRAVIVTGGFHAEGLKKLAALQGCAYMQITPRVDEITKRDHEIYLRSIFGSRDFETSQMSAWLTLVKDAMKARILAVKETIQALISSAPVMDQPLLRGELALAPAFGGRSEVRTVTGVQLYNAVRDVTFNEEKMHTLSSESGIPSSMISGLLHGAAYGLMQHFSKSSGFSEEDMRIFFAQLPDSQKQPSAVVDFLAEIHRQVAGAAGRSEVRKRISKKTVEDIADILPGKRIIERADFNVKVKKGKITDDTRLRASVPTIQYLLDHGVESLTLMSHLGDPEKDIKAAKKAAEKAGQPFDEKQFLADNAEKYDLAPVAARLAELLGREVLFARTMEEAREMFASLPKGGILLLPNTRFDKREKSKDAEERAEMGKELAYFGDIFVNDAFGTAHRENASTVEVAHFLPAVAGFLMEKEVLYFQEYIMNDPARPFVAVSGGSKLSSKIPVLKSLIKLVDRLVIGGGMAYTFLKAQGHTVGTSLVEDDELDTALEILKDAKARGVQIVLPADHGAATEYKNDASRIEVEGVDIPEGLMGLDVGPKTVAQIEQALEGAQTVLMNGPISVFEFNNFEYGTRSALTAIAGLMGLATTVTGGGDTLAALNKAGLADKVSHPSTGGGAALELISGNPLYGVEALDDYQPAMRSETRAPYASWQDFEKKVLVGKVLDQRQRNLAKVQKVAFVTDIFPKDRNIVLYDHLSRVFANLFRQLEGNPNFAPAAIFLGRYAGSLPVSKERLAEFLQSNAVLGNANYEVHLAGDILYINGLGIKVYEGLPTSEQLQELGIDYMVEMMRYPSENVNEAVPGLRTVIIPAEEEVPAGMTPVVNRVNGEELAKNKTIFVAEPVTAVASVATKVAEELAAAISPDVKVSVDVVEATRTDRQGDNFIDTLTTKFGAMLDVILGKIGMKSNIRVGDSAVMKGANEFTVILRIEGDEDGLNDLSVTKVNDALKKGSEGSWKGVVDYKGGDIASNTEAYNPATFVVMGKHTAVQAPVHSDGQHYYHTISIKGFYSETGHAKSILDMMTETSLFEGNKADSSQAMDLEAPQGTIPATPERFMPQVVEDGKAIPVVLNAIGRIGKTFLYGAWKDPNFLIKVINGVRSGKEDIVSLLLANDIVLDDAPFTIDLTSDKKHFILQDKQEHIVRADEGHAAILAEQKGIRKISVATHAGNFVVTEDSGKIKSMRLHGEQVEGLTVSQNINGTFTLSGLLMSGTTVSFTYAKGKDAKFVTPMTVGVKKRLVIPFTSVRADQDIYKQGKTETQEAFLARVEEANRAIGRKLITLFPSVTEDTLVLETSGKLIEAMKLFPFYVAGTGKGVISAPAKATLKSMNAADMAMVPGVNTENLLSVWERLVTASCASCTTNGAATGIAGVLDLLNVVGGYFVTIHAITKTQGEQMGDYGGKSADRAYDGRRTIVGTSTGATGELPKALPILAGLLQGISFRVGNDDGSLIYYDLNVEGRVPTVEEINKAVLERVQIPIKEGGLKGSLGYGVHRTSQEIIGSKTGGIFDPSKTQVNSNGTVTLGLWYDNEGGYEGQYRKLALLMGLMVQQQRKDNIDIVAQGVEGAKESGANAIVVGNEAANDALKNALETGIQMPILNIFVSKADQENGSTEAVINSQITQALAGIPAEDVMRVMMSLELEHADGASFEAYPAYIRQVIANSISSQFVESEMAKKAGIVAKQGSDGWKKYLADFGTGKSDEGEALRGFGNLLGKNVAGKMRVVAKLNAGYSESPASLVQTRGLDGIFLPPFSSVQEAVKTVREINKILDVEKKEDLSERLSPRFFINIDQTSGLLSGKEIQAIRSSGVDTHYVQLAVKPVPSQIADIAAVQKTKSVIEEGFKMIQNLMSDYAESVHWLKNVPEAHPRQGAARSELRARGIEIYAQHFSLKTGAATGSVSSHHLEEVGVAASLLGHSERRTRLIEIYDMDKESPTFGKLLRTEQQYGDSDEAINQKLKAAARGEAVKQLLCMGEPRSVRDQGDDAAIRFVLDQLTKAFEGMSEQDILNALKDRQIAYEPIWAINTGLTATPEQAQSMQHAIRNWLAATYSPAFADSVTILYGGSAKPDNVGNLLRQRDIDGFLVGGASLQLESFSKMGQIMAEVGDKGNGRTPILAANWKAEPQGKRTDLNGFISGLAAEAFVQQGKVGIIIAPPHTLLDRAVQAVNAARSEARTSFVRLSAGEKIADMAGLLKVLDGIVVIDAAKGTARLKIGKAEAFKAVLPRLIHNIFVSPDNDVVMAIEWVLMQVAPSFGAILASSRGLYEGFGSPEYYMQSALLKINQRALVPYLAQAMLEVSDEDQAVMVSQFAVSELAYTANNDPQRVSAVHVAVAILSGYQGPIFVSLDHLQIKKADYDADRVKALNGAAKKIRMARASNIHNVDIDTSTLALDPDKHSEVSVYDQQRPNFENAVLLAIYNQLLERIYGYPVAALNGEVGEVGNKPVTSQELDEYLNGFEATLGQFNALGAKGQLEWIMAHNDIFGFGEKEMLQIAGALSDTKPFHGVSAMSCQVGSAHGGVKVKGIPWKRESGKVVDDKLVQDLSAVAQKHKVAGLILHGASSLPPAILEKAARNGVVAVHLATYLHDIIFNHPAFPTQLIMNLFDAIEKKNQKVYNGKHEVMGDVVDGVQQYKDVPLSEIINEIRATIKAGQPLSQDQREQVAWIFHTARGKGVSQAEVQAGTGLWSFVEFEEAMLDLPAETLEVLNQVVKDQIKTYVKQMGAAGTRKMLKGMEFPVPPAQPIPAALAQVVSARSEMRLADAKISAKEIKDSRGKSTVQVTFTLGDITTTGDVPAGASKGEDEAKTVTTEQAIQNINETIVPLIKNSGLDLKKHEDLRKLEAMIINLAGDNFKDLGANATVPMSWALWKMAAALNGMTLAQYIRKFEPKSVYENPEPVRFLMNIFNGGLHALKAGEELGVDRIDIQEIMIVPVSARTYREALEMGDKIDFELKQILVGKFGAEKVTRADEAGFSVKGLGSSDEAIAYVFEAIKAAGYEVGRDVKLALDVAASSFYGTVTPGKYRFQGKDVDSADMVAYYDGLVAKYGSAVRSIEDGLAENDWKGWRSHTENMTKQGVKTIGDDLFVTQLKRLNRGIEESSATAILIKVNQNGTLSGTLDTMAQAKANGMVSVVSHRSGETIDSAIADLADGTNAWGLKTGDPQPEYDFGSGKQYADRALVRRSKYDRMVALEEGTAARSEARNAAVALETPEQIAEGVKAGYVQGVDPMLPRVKDVKVITIVPPKRPAGIREQRYDFLHATNLAAYRSAQWMHNLGRSQVFTKALADSYAAHWTREYLNRLPWLKAEVAIGEGERDEEAMLYIGELLGNEEFRNAGNAAASTDALASDVVELTNGTVSNEIKASVSILALAPYKGIRKASDIYFQKINVGPAAKNAEIDVRKTTRENMTEISRALSKPVSKVVVALLLRPSHVNLITELVEAGIDVGHDPLFDDLVQKVQSKASQKELDAAYVKLDEAVKKVGRYRVGNLYLLADGDLTPSFAFITPDDYPDHVDVVMGRGGSPEGILSAVVIKALNGKTTGRLASHASLDEAKIHADLAKDGQKFSPEEAQRLVDKFRFARPETPDAELRPGQKRYTDIHETDDLVSADDYVVVASAIKDNPWVNGLTGPKVDLKAGEYTVSSVRAGSSGGVYVIQTTYEMDIKTLRAKLDGLYQGMTNPTPRASQQYAEAAYDLGKAYLLHQEFDKAIALFQLAQGIDPRTEKGNYYHAAVEHVLGIKALLKGEDEEGHSLKEKKDGNPLPAYFDYAVQRFKKALELNANDRDADLRTKDIFIDLLIFLGKKMADLGKKDKSGKSDEYYNLARVYFTAALAREGGHRERVRVLADKLPAPKEPNGEARSEVRLAVDQPQMSAASFSETLARLGVSLPGVVKTAQLADGIFARAIMEATLAKEALLKLVAPNYVMARDEKALAAAKATLPSDLRVNMTPNDVLLLGNGVFAANKVAVVGLRKVYSQASMIVVVNTAEERQFLDALNALLAKEGLQPIFAAGADRATGLREYLKGVKKPMIRALLFNGELLPAALLQQLPEINPEIVTRGMLMNFANAVTPLVNSIVMQLQARYAILKSA